MSAFSANRFALLDEAPDSDNEGQAAAPKTKDAQFASSQPSKPVPAPTQKAKPASAQKGRDYPARGGARNVLREDRPPAETGGSEVTRETRGERGRGGRGGPRGGRGALGRGRGGRGGAKADRPDRHSATGVTDTDKKIASGWGAEEGKQELQAENDGWGDANAEVSAPGTPGANGTKPAEGETAPAATGGDEVAAPVEEEDQTKTLDEYLAERAAAARIGPNLSARKANEGADDTQWKDGVQLLRGDAEDADWFFGKAKKGPVGSKKQKEGKTFIEVESQGYRPPRSDRGGGGRGRGEGRGRGRGEGGGGRGRGEGGRGRGGFRGQRSGLGGHPREFNTNDSTAFPSLS